jgi:hypothetical protein
MNDAVTIVAAALQSGAIKLPGTSTFGSSPVENAAADAEYLNKLLNSLAENLSKDGGASSID